MNSAALPSFALELPWDLWEQQDQRFRRIRLAVLVLVLLLSALIALLPAPLIERIVTAPPPLPIQLVLEPRPPVAIAPPKPVVAAALEPAQAPPLVPPKPVVLPRPKPQQLQKENKSTERSGSPLPGPTARERANAAGVGSLASQLSSLRDDSVASKAITGRPDLTGTPRPDRTAEFDGGNASGAGSERALITAKAGQSSGGINTAALSRGVGGGGLAGRGTTQVAGYGGGGNGNGPGIGRGGHGGGGSGGGGIGTGGTGSGPGSGGGAGARSREEIEMIFDQNKGAIYALYNRALRSDPALQGKLVLELTIQPNGMVTACRIVSMEFEAPEFKAQLVKRVMMFRFEDRDVAPVTTTKPIDFFPS